MAEQLSQTYNIDINSIANRMCRFVDEIQGFQSANGSEMHPEDLIRLKSYLTGLRTFVNTVQQLERMDYVETNADLEPLRQMPAKIEMENESMNDVNVLLRRAHLELTHSASARQSSKMNKYDEGRLSRSIVRAETLITDYVEVVTPLDMPNSSPRTSAVGEGKTGI